MTLTPLGISALALLHERDMHPYEMYQLLLERHEDRIVKVTAGSLYRTVEKLTEAGLAVVSGTERAGNRPERTVYAATDAGRKALVERVRDILRSPAEEFHAFTVGIAEAHSAPAAAVGADLVVQLDQLDSDLAELDHIIALARQRGVAECYWLTADYLRHTTQARRDWISRFVERLETGEIPWP